MSRIKEVNGIKVLRRYGAGSIFSGLICLALCIAPILMLFVPFVDLKVVNQTVGAEASVYNVTMLDVIKYACNVEKGEWYTSVFDTLGNMPHVENMPSYSWMNIYGPAIFYSMFVCWIALCVLCLILLFLGLEFLFRGKVSHYKLAYRISWGPLIIAFIIIGLVLSMLIIFLDKGKFVLVPAEGDEAAKCLQVEVGIFVNAINICVWILGTILLGVLYSTCFKNRVFIGDLGDIRQAGSSSQELEKREIKYETREVVKVRYEPSVGLPNNLKTIGGHAFSNNLNIKIAMIPLGIDKLGQGAFANCTNLEVVSIPKSVKLIGFNCFWNCKSLKRINYAGSKEEWRHIKRGSNWLTKAGTYTVVCNDGAIIVNPYH